jgi:hypothetical protein
MRDEDDKSESRDDDDSHRRARSSKFRFKSTRKSRHGKSKVHSETDDEDAERPRKRIWTPSPTRHRHGKRHKQKAEPTDDHGSTDETRVPHSRTSQHLDPDDAFKESLFDALADDEGAAYWEGVYGQPIHVYPREKETEGGELEQMNDEEYAAYVRTRMWEKSHQHIIEERKRREEELKKRRQGEERQREEANRIEFDALIDEALRQGRRRKRNSNWQAAWTTYLDKWERFLERAAKGSTDGNSKEHFALIPWPVESGSEKDVDKDAVETFFRRNPADDLPTILKAERVRWHPDKMQQRLRAVGLDSVSLSNVTAVFQIIDNMWTDLKR